MAPTGTGASPGGSPRSGSSPPWTPRPGTPANPSRCVVTGFAGTWPAEPQTGLITDAELTQAAADQGSDAVVGQKLLARDRYQPSGDDSDGGAGAPHVDSEPGIAEPEPSVVAADHGAAQPDSAAAGQAGESHHVAAATGVAAVVDAVVAVTVAALIDGGQPDTARGASLEVYADSAYGSGAARAGCQRGGHDTKPLVPAVAGGFSLDDFPIDEPAGTVSCPGGHTRTMTAKRAVTFGAVCAQCPLRSRCTTAKDGRSMTIHPHEQPLRAA